MIKQYFNPLVHAEVPAGGEKGLIKFMSSMRNFKGKHTTSLIYEC